MEFLNPKIKDLKQKYKNNFPNFKLGYKKFFFKVDPKLRGRERWLARVAFRKNLLAKIKLKLV